MSMLVNLLLCIVDCGVIKMRKRNLPEGLETAQEPEDSKNAKDLWTGGRREGNDDVDQGDEDKASIHDVPPAAQVGVFVQQHALRRHLGGGGNTKIVNPLIDRTTNKNLSMPRQTNLPFKFTSIFGLGRKMISLVLCPKQTIESELNDKFVTYCDELKFGSSAKALIHLSI